MPDFKVPTQKFTNCKNFLRCEKYFRNFDKEFYLPGYKCRKEKSLPIRHSRSFWDRVGYDHLVILLAVHR
jgi:hypothetical protein